MNSNLIYSKTNKKLISEGSTLQNWNSHFLWKLAVHGKFLKQFNKQQTEVWCFWVLDCVIVANITLGTVTLRKYSDGVDVKTHYKETVQL